MSKKDIRTTIGTLIAIAGICSVLIFISYYHPTVESVKSHASEFSAVDSANSATIIIRDAGVRQFQGAVTPTMTILDALYAATQSGGIEFRYQLASNNTVKDFSLNNKPSIAWQISLNGQAISPQKISATSIKSGYVVEISTK